MNNSITYSVLGLCLSSLIGCGQGFITTNSPPAPVYSFSSDYSIIINPVLNCNIYQAPFVCNTGSSSITINISYTSSYPSAYLQLPLATQLPSGVNLSNISQGCSNTTGNNYSCIFTLTGSNVAESTILSIPYNGSLGFLGGISVVYQ